MLNRNDPNGDGLEGCRVLAILPLSRKERTRYVFDILAAAKTRWNWHIDVICQSTDKKPFDDLVAPTGAHYSPPHLLKVADWERDPKAAAELDLRIREAEILADLPLGRVVLAGGHSIGRAFNAPFRYQPRYRIVQRTFADNIEPFRIVRRLFRFADETLAAARPNMVIAFDWATPMHFSMWLAANRRGIPCVTIRNSKINHDHAFWTTDRLLLNTAALEQAEVRRQSKMPASSAAAAFIREFREKPRTIAYIATKWHHKTQRRFVRWHIIQVRRVVRELLNTCTRSGSCPARAADRPVHPLLSFAVHDLVSPAVHAYGGRRGACQDEIRVLPDAQGSRTRPNLSGDLVARSAQYHPCSGEHVACRLSSARARASLQFRAAPQAGSIETWPAFRIC